MCRRSPSTAREATRWPSGPRRARRRAWYRRGIASRHRVPRSSGRNGNGTPSSGAKAGPQRIAHSWATRWRLRFGTCGSRASMAMSRSARKSGASPLPATARCGRSCTGCRRRAGREASTRGGAGARGARAARAVRCRRRRRSCARGADRRAAGTRRDWAFAYADPRVDVGKAAKHAAGRRSPATKSRARAVRCSCRKLAARRVGAGGGAPVGAHRRVRHDRAGVDRGARVRCGGVARGRSTAVRS